MVLLSPKMQQLCGCAKLCLTICDSMDQLARLFLSVGFLLARILSGVPFLPPEDFPKPRD